VKVRDLAGGEIKSDELLRTAPEIDSQYERSRLAAGDILLGIRGSVGDVAVVPPELRGGNITQDSARLRISKQISRDFVVYALQCGFVRMQIRLATVGQAVTGINIRDVRKLVIPLPALVEQRAIASVLLTWDRSIRHIVQLIAAKTKLKKGLMQQLLTGKRRLNGAVEQPWQSHRLEEFLRQRNVRNHANDVGLVLSVTNSQGFVRSDDYFEGRVYSADTSHYKMIRKGWFAYNPSRINVGSIARLGSHEVGILSPMYVVFEVVGSLLPEYLEQWLQSHEASERIRHSAAGSVRETVNFRNFGGIRLHLPPAEEQRRIACVLATADREIDLLRQQLEKLQLQKRGLMRKLLTGQVRVKV